MDFKLTPEQESLESKCREFAHENITPFLKLLEDDLEFRYELYRKMSDQGLFTLTIPKEDGGSFIDTTAYVIALKTIAKADAGIAVAMAVTNMVAETLFLHGTSQQKQKYLPLICTGKCVPLSFALTEKKAGSDVKNIQTFAAADPDGPEFFLLKGDKQFITNGDIASLVVVFAKVNPTKENPNITAFLVDRGCPRFSITKKENKLGLLTANLVDLKFDNCRLHQNQLLGGAGNGLKIALSALDSGRIGVAAQAVGIAEAAFESALKHAKQRSQFGRALAENQAIAFKLADMKVKLSCATLMLYKASWKKDQGEPFTLEAAEAKLFCSEVCNEIANETLQIFGGYGYVKDYPAEKYFRDARVTTLYEGTSEIQRIVISRKILS